jgi:hypothetical protein
LRIVHNQKPDDIEIAGQLGLIMQPSFCKFAPHWERLQVIGR